MAILATEKVLTLDYWKPARKIEVGDYVFDKDGKLVKVKLVQEYRSESCYEVVFNDYLSVRGDTRLGFPVETPKCRVRQCTYKQKQKFRRPLRKKKVEELATAQLKDNRGRLLYSVPTTKSLELPHQDLPVPPFLFGFWFFNRRANGTMAAPRGFSEKIHQKFKDHGYKLTLGRRINTGEQEFSVFPTFESQLAPFVPNRIPNNYLLASAEQRLELLKGILHAKSRQYSKTKDSFRVTSFNYSAIQQIQALVESLGHRTTTQHDETLNNYTIFFKSRIKLVDNQVSPPLKVYNARRYIKKIEPLPPQACVHIETTGTDNTILVGEGFISCL